MPPRMPHYLDPPSPDELNATERRLGLELPADYRSFLLSCNGGPPVPGWFRHGDSDEDFAQITQLWSLAQMETETRSLQRHTKARRFVSIGAVSDEDQLLLSLAADDPGAILWQGADEGDGREAVRVAGSFEQLFNALDYPDSAKPWMKLIDDGDLDGLRAWLDAGGSVNACDAVITGISALEHAAMTGRLEAVKLLASRGARAGSSFWYARQGGHAKVAKFLKEQGLARGGWWRWLLGLCLGVAAMGLTVASARLPRPDQTTVGIVLGVVAALAGAIALGYDWLVRRRK